MQTLTIDQLHEVLDYNPETGIFIRKCHRGVGGKAGSHDTNGYLGIRVNVTRYLAHRLAWFYVHGSWPANDIDHINGVKDDNRIANLREATATQNMRNIDAPKHNTSGIKGVCYDKRNSKWMAYIVVNGKFKNLGRYANLEDAGKAYENYSLSTFGEFTRLKKSA
jgi:hypothetical protein